jgi:hypothetical protein
MDEKLDAELGALFDKLVASESRVDMIAEIDYQLKVYKENPGLYILPNACKWMTPALENFGEDPQGWLRFIRRVRQEFAKRSQASQALARVYRKVDSRVDAMIRRGRLVEAVTAYTATHGAFVDSKQEKAYTRDLQQLWTLSRKNRLALMRRVHGGEKIPYEVQTGVYDGFWEETDADIKRGEVPHRDELPGLLAKAKKLNHMYYGDTSDDQE